MTALLSITETQVMTALRTFLLDVLPAGIVIDRGQDNYVPEPGAANFIVMTPARRVRLATNVDTDTDAVFVGSIAATVLTITEVGFGTIGAGSSVFGVGVTAGTKVVAQLSGTPGGIGTYSVTPTQTVASEVIAAGSHAALQATEVTVQLDLHGPASTDNAQIIATLLRDMYAVDYFRGLTAAPVTPLYATDGRQIPFINGEGQYEDRWVVEAVLQANPVVSTGQQFADTLTVGVIDVDAAYPP